MGRPLKKDINGVNVIGSAAYGATGDKEAGIMVEFWDTELRTDGAIVKQRGAKTYVVAQIGNVIDTNINLSTLKSTCTLQEEEPAAPGQMRIVAQGPTGDVYIAKLTRRLATAFDGTRFKWSMSNYEDSFGDKIVLVPVG